MKPTIGAQKRSKQITTLLLLSQYCLCLFLKGIPWRETKRHLRNAALVPGMYNRIAIGHPRYIYGGITYQCTLYIYKTLISFLGCCKACMFDQTWLFVVSCLAQNFESSNNRFTCLCSCTILTQKVKYLDKKVQMLVGRQVREEQIN